MLIWYILEAKGQLKQLKELQEQIEPYVKLTAPPRRYPENLKEIQDEISSEVKV